MPFEPIAQGYSQTPLSAQLARLLFLQGASLIHMMRWQSGYCSGLQPRVPPVRVRNASPFSQRSWIPFEPTAKGYTQHPLANHLLVPLLQSGPKSPPTCSRVGLAWVRLASSLALLQRRQAMRGGSRFNQENLSVTWVHGGPAGRNPVLVADDIGFESYVTDHF